MRKFWFESTILPLYDFYSNDFRFSTRTQAEDRVYRYGQEKDVYIYDIYASSKIDLRILEAISNKESLLLRFKNLKRKRPSGD